MPGPVFFSKQHYTSYYYVLYIDHIAFSTFRNKNGGFHSILLHPPLSPARPHRFPISFLSTIDTEKPISKAQNNVFIVQNRAAKEKPIYFLIWRQLHKI